MRKLLVRDVMVPLEEYATIHEDSLLVEAIHVLERFQKEIASSHYVHRAILVYDDDNKIIGKISQLDVIRSLEPKYENFGIRSTSLSGLSPEFIKAMVFDHDLCQADLDSIGSRIADKQVKEIMYEPTEGEKIEENATFGQAVHQFIIGHHQSLLVTKGHDVVGVLRLADMFNLVCGKIKEKSAKKEGG